MSGEPRPDSRTLHTPPGGILTREVGAITGEVEVALVWAGTYTVAEVRYAGADEWYTVTGDANSLTISEVVKRLADDPGLDADGNPKASQL